MSVIKKQATKLSLNSSVKSDNLRIACLQFAPIWNEPIKSRQLIESIIQQNSLSKDSCDLLVLPEMFASGFSLNEIESEPYKGDSYQWMARLAQELDAAVVGSVKTKTDNGIFNRLYWVTPEHDNLVSYYDKVHLFGAERKVIKPGNYRVTIDFRGFTFLVQTCYDLRFPVFCRNQDDYDVLLNVASWPKPRIHHWNALLKARAIENLSYVIGVNRVGEDGNDWLYVGESQVLDPVGETLAHAKLGATELITAELSLQHLKQSRSLFTFLEDRDCFDLHLK
ncbi:MAG: hypothetical protein HWE27_13445 [Gammaproteobacteria bacterium]|nr:hypothetical protein [Gammaproteobacteria bacterium]